MNDRALTVLSVLFFIVISMNGCATNPKNPGYAYSQLIESPAGGQTQFVISEWEGQDICVEMVMHEPKFHDPMDPRIAFVLKNDDDSLASSIGLITVNEKNGNTFLDIQMSGSTDGVYFQPTLRRTPYQLGDHVFYGIHLDDQNMLNVTFERQTYTFKLPSKMTKLELNAVSAKGTINYSIGCNVDTFPLTTDANTLLGRSISAYANQLDPEKHFESIEKNFLEAIQIFKQTNARLREADAYYLIGQIYIKRSEEESYSNPDGIASASNYMNMAFETYKDINENFVGTVTGYELANFQIRSNASIKNEYCPLLEGSLTLYLAKPDEKDEDRFEDYLQERPEYMDVNKLIENHLEKYCQGS